jgi:hypothetical protein
MWTCIEMMGDHKLISCTLMVDVVASNNDILVYRET